MFGHTLKDKQVKPYGRGHLCHLNYHNNENPEPDHINSGLADHRLNNGHSQHNRGNAVKEHAQNNIKYRQRSDQNNGR